MKIKNSRTIFDRKNINHFKIGFLYLFMIMGGLLQTLGIQEDILLKMASLVMAILSAWLMTEFFLYVRKQAAEHKNDYKRARRLVIWFTLVFTISVLIENVGVKTGMVFGEYAYGPVLWPFIGYVPAAIGFAWINMLIPSLILACMILLQGASAPRIVLSVLTGLLMVIFDFFLEPAAIELNFWTWAAVAVPWQNYLAWFVLGTLFTYTGLRLDVLKHGYPRFLYHAYFSQLIYFLLILAK